MNYQTAKHIDIRHHFICHILYSNQISIDYLPSAQNLVYIFTKSLGRLYLQKSFIQSSLLSRALPRRPIVSLDYVVDRKRAKFSLSSSLSSSSPPPHHPNYHQPLLVIVIMFSTKGILRRIKRILAAWNQGKECPKSQEGKAKEGGNVGLSFYCMSIKPGHVPAP